MPQYAGLERRFQPDWRGLVNNIARKGTPDRVYFMELFHDRPIALEIAKRFDLAKGIDANDPDLDRKRYIATQRFCGMDYVIAGVIDLSMGFNYDVADDTAGLTVGEGKRSFINEHVGPITTWEQFERFKWPDPNRPAGLRDLEWYQKNLPDDMCMIGGLTGHFCEEVIWLMGYETCCYALFEQRDLVQAIADRLGQYYRDIVKHMLEFDRLKMVWGTDDMGFKTGLLISPNDTRQFVLPGHKMLAKMCHDAGRPYLLHSCGKLDDIMEDLIEDVKIDAKHSFEDTIQDVRQAKQQYGKRIAMIGGVDVDFLCRSDEQAIRARVRDMLDKCQSGGGYAMGTGNSVANYIPVENYLAMVDEGRLYTA